MHAPVCRSAIPILRTGRAQSVLTPRAQSGVVPGIPLVQSTKEQSMIRNPKRLRRVMVSSALLAGVTLGGAGIASAATGTTTTPSSSSSTGTSGAPSGTPPAGAPDPATLTHGRTRPC